MMEPSWPSTLRWMNMPEALVAEPLDAVRAVSGRRLGLGAQDHRIAKAQQEDGSESAFSGALLSGRRQCIKSS